MTREETKKIREFAFAFAALLAIVSRVRLWRGHDPHLAWFFGAGEASCWKKRSTALDARVRFHRQF